MTSSIFIIKNIDTIMMSLESLDIYAIDSMLIRCNLIQMTDLFIFRINHLLKYNYHLDYEKLYYIIIIFQQIIEGSSQKYLRYHIKHILQELSNKQIDNTDYSLSTQVYINRFLLNYRNKIKPYLIGYDKYHDTSWVTKISIVNLFMLYQLTKSDNLYKIFLYLKYNNTHA